MLISCAIVERQNGSCLVSSTKYPQYYAVWIRTTSHERLVLLVHYRVLILTIVMLGAGVAKRPAEASPEKSPEAAKRPRLNAAAADNAKPVSAPPPNTNAPTAPQPGIVSQPAAPGGISQLPKYILDHPQAKQILEHMKQSTKALQDLQIKLQHSRQGNNPAATNALEIEFQKTREFHLKLTEGAKKFFAGIQQAHVQQQAQSAAGGGGPPMNPPAPSSVPPQRPPLSGSPKVQAKHSMSGPPQIPPGGGGSVPMDVQNQMQKLVEANSRQVQQQRPNPPVPAPANAPHTPGSARVIVWRGQIIIRSSMTPANKDISVHCAIHAPPGVNL